MTANIIGKRRTGITAYLSSTLAVCLDVVQLAAGIAEAFQN